MLSLCATDSHEGLVEGQHRLQVSWRLLQPPLPLPRLQAGHSDARWRNASFAGELETATATPVPAPVCRQVTQVPDEATHRLLVSWGLKQLHLSSPRLQAGHISVG